MITRPRDAASLVVLREGEGGPEVLVGRRGMGNSFMPGVYVFPGGRVAPSDGHPPPGVPVLRPPTAQALGRSGSRATARALAVAALRETWEETGLIVGREGALGDHPPKGPLPEGAQPGGPYWTACRRAGLVPALDALVYFARAITPTRLSTRYNTRFLLACGTLCHGALAGDGELEDVGWRPVDATESLPMAGISRHVLQEAVACWQRRGPPAVTLLLHRGGRRLVRRAPLDN